MFAASITFEEIRLMALGARSGYALAMRTLGANLAMAGLCAELSRRSDLYEIRSAGDRAWITSCLRERGVL